MLKAVAFQTIFAWILATAVYQIGSRIMNNTINLSDILIIGIILVVVCFILFRNDKKSKCSGCPYSKSCNN